MLMLPMLLIMNQIDWTNEQYITYTQIGFGIVHVIAGLALGYLYQLVTSKNDKTKIKVAPAQSLTGQQTAPVEMTICEYDVSQLKKSASQLALGFVICSVMFYQWKFIQPLFIQIAMTPANMVKNPLFKIHVLGRKGDVEKRPFKEDNPFMQMMNPQSEEPTKEKEEQKEEPEEEEKVEKVEKVEQKKIENKPKKKTKKVE